MSITKPTNHLSWLRWNLSPTSAALWQLATKQACETSNLRASWIDVELDWKSSFDSDLTSLGERFHSTGMARPVAFVVGIERETVVQLVARARTLSQFCRRWTLDGDDQRESTTGTTFLIGWFPQVDLTSNAIFRELGFDLVLSNPATLRSVLNKIVGYANPSSSSQSNSSSLSQ